MTALPSNATLTTVPSTHGTIRAALGDQRDFLAGLLGTNGTAITALQTLGAFATNYVAKTGAYTVLTTDRGKVIDATSGTWTLTLPAVSGLGGFSFEFRNSGSGTVTIDGNAAELVDGATTLAVPPGNAVLLICTGTAWVTCWMMRPGATVVFSGAPSASVPFEFASGAVGAPSVTFSGDLDTGMWRPGANLLAFSAAGSEALRISSSKVQVASPVYIGTDTDVSGVGAAGFQVQGVGPAGNATLARFSNNITGPILSFSKSRAGAINSYTILTAGDIMGNLEFYGADGSTEILGARVQVFNLGTPAAGDVRGGIRFQTGSGAGAVTTRLTIHDTHIAATIPIAGASYTVAGLPAAGTVGAGATAFVTNGTVAHAGNSGNIVAGGGANFVPVYSDGTNWRIM